VTGNKNKADQPITPKQLTVLYLNQLQSITGMHGTNINPRSAMVSIPVGCR
jgi:hypothetical protein